MDLIITDDRFIFTGPQWVFLVVCLLCVIYLIMRVVEWRLNVTKRRLDREIAEQKSKTAAGLRGLVAQERAIDVDADGLRSIADALSQQGLPFSAECLHGVADRLVSEHEQRKKLQRFKDFVHRRLDEAGIPESPDGEHARAGCRIGQRLQVFQEERDRLRSLVAKYLQAYDAGLLDPDAAAREFRSAVGEEKRP